MTIHLGHRFPGGSSGYPAPRRATCERSLFALHRTGFGEPPCRHDAGGLLPHLFTLTGRHLRRRAGRRSAFLCHFPSAFAAWGFPSALPFGVRTFLGPLARPAATRPAWQCSPPPRNLSCGARSEGHMRRRPASSRCSPSRAAARRLRRHLSGRRSRGDTAGRRGTCGRNGASPPRRADSPRPAVASRPRPRPRPSRRRAPSRSRRRSC